MKRVFVESLVLPLLLACSVSQGDTPRRESASCQTQNDPFACVRTRCQEAGGTYQEATQQCDCGPGRTFSAWDRGVCERPSRSAACLREEGGFTAAFEEGGEEALEECLRLAEVGNTEGFISAPPSLRGAALARWLDTHGETFRKALDRTALLPQLHQVEWVAGPADLSRWKATELAKLMDPPSILFHSTAEPVGLSTVHYLVAGENYQEALTVGARPNPSLPAQRASSPLLQRLVQGANGAFSQPFSQTRWVAYSDDGCAGRCDLIQEGSAPTGPFTRTRRMVAGQWFSETLILWEDDSKDRAFAQLALLPSGDVSLVHLLSVDRADGTELTARYQIYDKHLNPLLGTGQSRPIVADRGSLLRQVKGMTPAASGTSAAQVVICEAGFTPDTLEQLGAESFLRGPLSAVASAPEQRRSLFGWVNSGRTGDLESTWGRFSASGYGAFLELGARVPFVRYEEHARKVSGIVQGYNRDVLVLPVGLEECFDHGERWIPQVLRASGARVVNLSATDNYERQACEGSPIARQIREQRNSLLYVVAAGNDGRDADREQVHYCPQQLSGAPNLIVVASGAGYGIAPTSNRGVRFADIVAEASHSEGGLQPYTTSMATPKVSRVAALIRAEHPSLTPERVRQAILLSADIDESWSGLNPLPVRSGGRLDETAVREMAERMEAHPDWSPETLLRKKHCWRINPECKEAQRRIDWFRRTGLIH